MKFNKPLVLSVFAFALTLALATSFGTSRAASTLVVDDNSACPGATFTTIQSAVNAASAGDTIKVCAGTYIENVTISVALSNLTLEGAQANQPYSGRTFGAASESTVNGTITIFAPDVSVNGFSITKTDVTFGVFGVHVHGTGHGAAISNNIFDTIVNTTTTSNSFTAQAIYLQTGPDNVSIEDNSINNVQSRGSAKGVLVGDNSVGDPSNGLIFEGNSVSNVTSQRGAYGISAARANGTSHTGLEVRDNNIRNLTGAWVHAVGLEGDTPGAIVEGNCFSSFTSPGIDKSAVFFEVNPGAATTEVHQNRFDLTAADFGIALHPFNQPAVAVDGENNWWGSPSGPTTPSNPGGTGAQVTSTVDYDPWLLFPPAGGACGLPVPTTKDQCKNGGWQTLVRADVSPFKNQGDCIQYANTGK
jgi:hypothetical protein